MPLKNAPREEHAFAAAECCRNILASVESPSDVRRLDYQTLAMLRARGAALTIHLENLTRAIEREAERDQQLHPAAPVRATRPGARAGVRR